MQMVNDDDPDDRTVEFPSSGSIAETDILIVWSTAQVT